MAYQIKIINYNNHYYEKFITKKWNIQHHNQSHFSLVINKNKIELKNNLESNMKNIWVEFNYKNMKKYQKDKKIKIIKTLGIKKNYFPHILDVTAGLGKDAFIFLSYGCKVTMVEQNPILSILLYDALKRSYQDPKMQHITKHNMKLIHNINLYINHIYPNKPDIIYLDPMFPPKKKNALPKKNIRIIQKLVGNNLNNDDLLNKFIPLARKKIVVKRPNYANYLSNIKPNYVIKTKKHRFDIYQR